MRREFAEKYSFVSNTSKGILCSIVPTLQQKEVDDRVAKAILTTGSPDIILDLQKLNGNPKSTLFNDFWAELSAFLILQLIVGTVKYCICQ